MTDLLYVKKNKHFKKAFKQFIFVSVVIAAVLGYGVYWAFFDVNRLPTGEFLNEETSPDGEYTLRAYVSRGSATVADSVRGELVYNNQNKREKNIYWNYRENLANIEWIDSDKVIINGHIIDVPNEKFDYRNP